MQFASPWWLLLLIGLPLLVRGLRRPGSASSGALRFAESVGVEIERGTEDFA